VTLKSETEIELYAPAGPALGKIRQTLCGKNSKEIKNSIKFLRPYKKIKRIVKKSFTK